MTRRCSFSHTCAVCLLGLLGTAGQAAHGQDATTTPHAGMLRYPDVSQTQIVFSYATNLWVVPKHGGMAIKLSSPAGTEALAKFSPDGSAIAFNGNYDGGRDLYVMDVMGGIPHRVTHHPGFEWLTDWTPQNELLFFQNGLAGLGRQTQIFTVSPEGGMPHKLPVPYGADGSLSDDGTWLAYTPHTRDTRTWKRYRGGMATDIWLFNVKTLESKKITDWEGTDTIPMWHGSKVYYLSDNGPNHKLNIWSYDTDSGRREQVTNFAQFDCKFPSMGPGDHGEGEIVFQNGASLYLLNLGSGKAQPVSVTIPGDRPRIRQRTIDASKFLAAGGISSTGKRAVVEARGDIWTVPAKHGPVRHITDTSGAAERTPSWSPDGKWIAYFSDATGEYELYLIQSDGKGEPRQVTSGNKTYFFSITWAPDSKSLIIVDKAGKIIKVDPETGKQRLLDRDVWANQPSVNFSRDSRWLTYALTADNGLSTIWIYDLENDTKHQVTSGFFRDSNPVFSRKGDYLYYTSNRDFSNPTYEDIGSTFVYDDTGKLLAVPLNNEVEYPWKIESDDETWDDGADEGSDEATDGGDKADDSNGDADDDSKASPDENADAPTSPIQGVWAGKASGLSQIPGMEQDEIEFKMTIIARDDGTFAGSSESMGESKPYDSVSFDEETGKLVATRSEGPITQKMEGTLDGDTITGTWTIVEMELSGPFTATRTDEEVDASAFEEEESEDKPIEIDFEGFEARAMELPVDSGNFSNLVSNDKGQLIYMRTDGPIPAIKMIDVTDEEPKEKTVLAGAQLVDISADGKKLLVASGPTKFAIVSAASGQSMSDTLSTEGLDKTIDPRQEWEEIFTDAWRRHRDFFYVKNMHGVDWDAVYERYHAMLKDAASRSDVSYIIGEMIGELNIGHAYYFGGDTESGPTKNVGMLGVDFVLDSQTDEDGNVHTAYKIAKMYHGAPWDSDARGPLNQPGLGVREGNYLLAVDGKTVDTSKDPWAAFIDTAGRETMLTIADALVGDDEARNERDVIIKPLSSEGSLRYRAWIEANRKYVEDASDGKVGYIYVPDTGVNGQNDLFRQFYGQIDKEALIIDERWNGGGQIPTRFIELLNRPRTNYWARRDGKDWPWPYDSHQGPKCMLINGLAGSGGDMFPWLFRFNKLGKLIGMRTWGGLVGISGVPPLIDGGYTSVPNFGFYEKNGTWGIEGHGVDPDIEVIDDPTLLAKGKDPQLDAAIAEMLSEIQTNGYHPPKRPADPDRSGMGVREEDK